MCPYEELTEATFLRYTFVSHVRIDSITEVKKPSSGRSHIDYPGRRLLHVTTLRHYRGERTETIWEVGFNSSCGVNLTTGEEWLVFSTYELDNIPNLSLCTPSAMMRGNRAILRVDQDDYYQTKVRLERIVHARNATAPKLTGTTVNYYTNGCAEEITTYVNGLRHGPSYHYYPNGSLLATYHYRRGLRTGVYRLYGEDGVLQREHEYDDKGIQIRYLIPHYGPANLRYEQKLDTEADNYKVTYHFPDGRLQRALVQRGAYTLSDTVYYELPAE